jgi:hypothetical protein
VSNLAQFVGGYGPIATIVNFFSGGGTSYTSGSLVASTLNNTKETVPTAGSLAAGTLSTVNNITGRGRLNLLTAYTKDATPRTVRCQVIIDGATVFDATSNSVAGVGYGMVPVGVMDGAASSQVFQPIDFYTSCVVKVASSLTEADKVATGINYETWA